MHNPRNKLILSIAPLHNKFNTLYQFCCIFSIYNHTCEYIGLTLFILAQRFTNGLATKNAKEQTAPSRFLPGYFFKIDQRLINMYRSLTFVPVGPVMISASMSLSSG